MKKARKADDKSVEKIKKESIDSVSYLFEKFIAEDNDIVNIFQKTEIKYIKTSLTNFDFWLGGGFPRGLMTEIHGVAGSGKTQMCFQLVSAFCLRNISKNFQKKALFVDTENSFYSPRLREVIVGNSNALINDDVETSLANVFITTALSPKKFVRFIKNLNEFLQLNKEISLIVIDSIAAPFWRSDKSGGPRTLHLVEVALELIRLAEVFGISVLLWLFPGRSDKQSERHGLQESTTCSLSWRLLVSFTRP